MLGLLSVLAIFASWARGSSASAWSCRSSAPAWRGPGPPGGGPRATLDV